LSVSVGIATVPGRHSPGDGRPTPSTALVAAADQALYQAKRKGRARCVAAPPMGDA